MIPAKPYAMTENSASLPIDANDPIADRRDGTPLSTPRRAEVAHGSRPDGLKRGLDVLLSGAALTVLAVPMALVAAAVKLSSPGPVFYLQERIGRGGRPFRLYKFRSMRPGNAGPQVTAGSDNRITPVGRVLRKCKLDELPQLWNVLRGDMALVGPRPEVERFVRHYTPEQRRVLEMTPGITGFTQLLYVDEEELLRGRADVEQAYLQEVMPQKLALDLEYARRRTLLLDLRILFATALVAVGLRAPARKLINRDHL